MNHLWPVISTWSPLVTASVMLARTSVPPWRSVMPMPRVAPFFSHHGSGRGSYSRVWILGSQRSSKLGSARSAPMQACVMVTGHMCPLSACVAR